MRNRGRYRYKLHLLTAENLFFHFVGESIRKEIDNMIIEAINRTRND